MSILTKVPSFDTLICANFLNQELCEIGNPVDLVVGLKAARLLKARKLLKKRRNFSKLVVGGGVVPMDLHGLRQVC